MVVPPRPVMAHDHVRHLGEAVALVIATSAATARDAAEAIDVSYDPLPAVIDGASALGAEAPQIWPQAPGNEAFRFLKGDRAATDAAFEGFRLTWEKPKTLLIWTGFFLVVNLLMPLALFGLGLNSQMAALEEVSRNPSQDPDVAIESMAALAPVYAILLPAGLVVQAMIAAAVFRLVLDPEDSRVHPVQFGAEEARLIVLALAYTLLFLVAVVAAVLFGGIIAGLAAAAGAGPFVGILTSFALMAGLVYVAVRMSLGPVITFSEGRIAVFDSWAMTRGLVWPILGAYVLAVIAVVIFYLLALVLAAALATLLSGGDLGALGRVMNPDMTSLQTFFSPGQVLMILFGALTSAVYNAVMSAPAAVMYREIRAQGAVP
jgi:hypothetical protein